MGIPDPNTPSEHLGPNRALPGVPIANLVLCTVALIVVSLRIYTRIWIKSVAGLDDWFIVVAMLCGIAFVAPQMIELYDGKFGHHRTHLKQDEINIDGLMNIACNVLSAASLAFSRASIIVFLLRIIGDIPRWKYSLYVANVLNVLTAFGSGLMYCILCIPIAAEWNKSVKGKCMTKEQFDTAVRVFTAFSVLVDFMCATIPFVAMQHVQIDRRTKLGLFAILGCGLLTASCGIGRAVALDFSTKDQQWDLVPLLYWQFAEMYGAIIFASLPALRQLFSHYQKYRTFRKEHTSYGYGGSSSKASRTTHASTPNTLNGTNTSTSARGIGAKNVAMGRNEVGRQTDLYVELNDIEAGRGMRSESFERLRGR